MNDTVIGALIGAGSAIGGTFVADWLSHKREIKSKVREAKSRILSNIIIQYRNLEKGIAFQLEIKMGNYIIIGIRNGSITNCPWTIEEIDTSNNSMADSVDLTWKENNIGDIELVHNLAILQAHKPKIANAISDYVNRYIGWQPDDINLTQEEAISYMGKPEWTTFSKTRKNSILSEFKVLHNDIVSGLGSPKLIKLLIKNLSKNITKVN